MSEWIVDLYRCCERLGRGLGRDLPRALALVVVGVLALLYVDDPSWIIMILGMAGAVLLTGDRWRSGSVLIAAVALAAGLLDLFAGMFSPPAQGRMVVSVIEPKDWTISDPDLGYVPRPNTAVRATSSFGAETLFRVTYTINDDSTRATPPSSEDADIYLFLGDSFVFGQGLSDDQTLAAQFARANDFKVRTINFSAPGYAPNQFVRAIEAGRFDGLTGRPVKGVVTWIIPAQLPRVGGDGAWLGASPHYVLENGEAKYAGSFAQYRWLNPLVGLRHLADQQFAFVHAIGARQRDLANAELFTALLVRLQQLARERFGAPLMVVYSWPDETSPVHHDSNTIAQPVLVSILAGLRQRGIPLLSVDSVISDYEATRFFIPHDGHPTAVTNQRVANELARVFANKGSTTTPP